MRFSKSSEILLKLPFIPDKIRVSELSNYLGDPHRFKEKFRK
jgi:hypothetical protein